MNTNYVYPSAQVGEFRNALLYASGPSSYSASGDVVYNPGSGEYINFPSDCRSVSGNYDVKFTPTAVGFNQIRAGGGGTSSAPTPSQSGWTAHWNYAPAAFSPDGVPLTLGTLSAAGTQSTYTAAGLVTVATTTPPPLGSFISLSNGASNYGIEFNGLIVYVSAVVPGVSYSFYAGQGSANHYTVNTDTLKWQQVQVSASNVLQALPLTTQITGVLATTALLTITQVLTAAQAASLPGQFVLLNGPFKTASAFAAGVIVQVASASTTGWTANWQGTIIAQTSAETAVASLLVTNGNVPVQSYPYITGSNCGDLERACRGVGHHARRTADADCDAGIPGGTDRGGAERGDRNATEWQHRNNHRIGPDLGACQVECVVGDYEYRSGYGRGIASGYRQPAAEHGSSCGNEFECGDRSVRGSGIEFVRPSSRVASWGGRVTVRPFFTGSVDALRRELQPDETRPEHAIVAFADGGPSRLEAIYDQTDWGFQKGFAGWLAPGMVFNGVGSFTTTPYSNQVIADATATAALVAYTGQPFLTQLQYRNPAFAIYDIVAYDYNDDQSGVRDADSGPAVDGAGIGDRAAVLHLPALLRRAGQGFQEVDCDSGLHERSAARFLEHYAGRLSEHRPAAAGSVFTDQLSFRRESIRGRVVRPPAGSGSSCIRGRGI